MADSCPTVCVTGAGAGVDSVWEQRKLEARKMLENAAESPVSSARVVRRLYVKVDVICHRILLYSLMYSMVVSFE